MPDAAQPDKTDIPIRSPYQDVPVNGTVRLYSGPIRLKTSNGEAIGNGNIELVLNGEPDIEFVVDYNSALGLHVDEGEMDIPAPANCTPSPFQTTNSNVSFPAGTGSISGVLSGEGLILREVKANDGKQEPVGRIQFHLLNFRRYRGTPLQEADITSIHAWKGRVTFSLGPWMVTLDQFRDIDKRIKEAKALGGYVFTHIGVLHRPDNKLFNPDDTESVFDALYWFLSFVKGARCAYALPIGLRHLGRPFWQKWTLPVASPVHKGENWFSENATLSCFSAADKFYACWTDPTKREWLNSALGIYLASNRFYGGIELTLANSQIALEMLTWVALLEENSLMSEEGFEKLAAADKIRALLFRLGVNVSIPVEFQKLKSAFPTFDAPEAVVRIRNLVIHPTKSNRAQRALISNDAVYEAWQLNQWYSELTLLKLIGYSGPYNNRTGNLPFHLWDMLPWTAPIQSPSSP